MGLAPAAIMDGCSITEWLEYHPTYYGAFVRDLDGNNVDAVWHAPPTG